MKKIGTHVMAALVRLTNSSTYTVCIKTKLQVGGRMCMMSRLNLFYFSREHASKTAPVPFCHVEAQGNIRRTDIVCTRGK